MNLSSRMSAMWSLLMLMWNILFLAAIHFASPLQLCQEPHLPAPHKKHENDKGGRKLTHRTRPPHSQ